MESYAIFYLIYGRPWHVVCTRHQAEEVDTGLRWEVNCRSCDVLALCQGHCNGWPYSHCQLNAEEQTVIAFTVYNIMGN